jgi:FkbM family methyltransferase
MIDSMLANGTGPYALDEVIRRAVAPNLPVVLKTQTKPPFWLAVYRKAEGVREDGPDGRWDSLAALVLSHGYWEYEETEVVYKILSDRCRTGTPIVVDVGGYVGYYTLLAAKMGCRVHVWEGSPRHAAMIQFSVWMNGLADRVSIHNNICAPGSKPLRFLGDNLNSHVANSFFGTDNPKFLQEILESAEEEKTGGLPVHPLAIDDVIQEEVLLLKVDVQGYEAHVFRSAKQLLARQMVCYVIFEFSMWRGMNVADGVQMVLDILSWGYTVSNIPHSRCKLEHFTTRWQVEQLALKLQKNADSCHKYNVYMLATRRNMPQIFALT